MALSMALSMDIEALIDQFRSPDYWRSLNPGLSVNEASAKPEAIALDSGDLDGIVNDLVREGYFQLPPCLPDIDVLRMAVGISALDEAGLPAVFAFVYDEFWQILQQLSPVLTRILGADFQPMPAFWAWYVPTHEDHSGWGRHRDRLFNTLRPDGMPNIMTVWIPLTDAIPLNGCMYVLPAHLDPHYHSELGVADIANVQDIRALPAEAGSVLGWTQHLLHWGSRSSSKAPFPRISLSFEFQRGDVDPFEAPPHLSAQELPSFEQRLGLIGRLMEKYKHMYQFSDELSAVAVALQGLLAQP